MNKLLKIIETSMDNFKIKKKLFILYFCCVLVPLIITDTLIVSLFVKSVQVSKHHEVENVANAVKYTFTNKISNAISLANSIYSNKYIYNFLDQDYGKPLDFVSSYQEFNKNLILGSSVNNFIVTFYTNNDSVIKGGKVQKIENAEDSKWYQYYLGKGTNEALCITFDKGTSRLKNTQRMIVYIRKLDFYVSSKYSKIVTVALDYSDMAKTLVQMNSGMPVYICYDGKILISNQNNNSINRDFETYVPKDNVYQSNIHFFNNDFTICVEEPPIEISKTLLSNMPIILMMIIINIVLPLIFVLGFNRSFTKRIHELSEALKKVDEEQLPEITNVRGKDEIGKLMKNYNKMVHRLNDLIQTVYISKMKEQEMTVARKNAELLALHSQINPHFLFNALESIRMHSILKKEYETADMVKCLAVLQRQYLEWNDDNVEIKREIGFVENYLNLQKYRFGDRLSYELDIDEDCENYLIPKLTIATFVENACVHGIESKAKPGWIFVRISHDEEFMVIEVEDTGNGMDSNFMEQLLSQMRNANLDMLKEKGRVGMINACLRLKMFTNNETQFDLEGEEGIGTIIQMKIPLIYVEQMV